MLAKCNDKNLNSMKSPPCEGGDDRFQNCFLFCFQSTG